MTSQCPPLHSDSSLVSAVSMSTATPSAFSTYASGLAEFPTTLPDIKLTPAQMTELYGLSGKLPARLAAELQAFEAWSVRQIQLDRGPRYAKPVRTSTFQGHVDAVRGYLGYIRRYGRRQDEALSLYAYAEPRSFIGFIAYLLRRGVGRAHLQRHVSLARKLNAYLASGGEGPVAAFASRIDAWLAALDGQISASMPRMPKASAPDFVRIFAWVDSLVSAARDLVQLELVQLRRRGLSFDAAWQVQCAVIAMLVTGSHVPPARLHLIKTLLHPGYVDLMACPHPDCKRENCKGNRFVIIPAAADSDGQAGSQISYGAVQSASATTPTPALPPSGGTAQRGLRFVCPHHKNESKGKAAIVYDLPEGDLVDLLLVHIDSGHYALTKSTPPLSTPQLSRSSPGAWDYNPYLFVTRTGIGFDNSRFSQFWTRLMSTAPPDLPYFPAQEARTAFVDDYSGAHGVAPQMWDGAAAAMGSSQGQWTPTTYRPSAVRKRTQDAVNHHVHFREAVRQRLEGVRNGGQGAVREP